MKKSDETKPACLCDTGAYCRVHQRYYRPGHLAGGAGGRSENDDDSILQQQFRCGGGRRVIRKKLND